MRSNWRILKSKLFKDIPSPAEIMVEEAQFSSSRRILTFAVSTPRSIEFYQDKLVAVDSFLEVVCSEDEHSLLLGDLRSHRSEGGGGAEERA